MLLAHGCGTGEPEFDKAVLYTPESLAEELAFRYQKLSPTAKSSGGAKANAELGKIYADAEKSEKARKKGVTSALPEKQAGPMTVDDLFNDIDNKLLLIKGHVPN